MAIKTTWTEVNQIIKEEFQRLVEKKKIQSRLQQINEELAQMEEDDASLMGEYNLEEVEAGSEMKVRSHAWTGEEDGDTKWTPEFDDSRAPALMEEEGEEDEDGEDIDLAEEFAELGAAIEAKIMAALGKAEEKEDETDEDETDEDETGEGESEVEDEVEDEDFEEVEVSSEEEGDTMEEYAEQQPDRDMDGDGDVDAKDAEKMKESLNESVSRNNKKYLNVLSEGLDTRKKSALESEVERMRRLANLGGNNE